MIRRSDKESEIIGELLFKQKYKFADKNLIAEVVEDTLNLLEEASK